MRERMRRRSVSSLVSPGPRVPMPPPSRDSAAPDPDEPWEQIPQLSELHLQPAFSTASTAREDVENQLCSIDDLPSDCVFDLAQLRGCQLAVEHDDISHGFGARRHPAVELFPRRGTSRGPAWTVPAGRAARPSAPAASASRPSSSSDRSASNRRRLEPRPTRTARSRAAVEPEQRSIPWSNAPGA